MRLDRIEWAEQVTEWADELDREMQAFRLQAEKAERAFKLDAWPDKEKRYWTSRNGNLVTLPDPYNVMLMFRRLIGGEMVVQIVTDEEDREAKELAEKREMWAQGFLYRLRREQKVNLRDQLAFWGVLRGRFVIDVRWVWDVMTKEQRKTRLPFLVRTLDPLNVLVRHGAFGPLYAIHQYTTTVAEVRDRWGEDGWRVTEDMAEDAEVLLRDYWDADYNAVLVDDKPLVEPWEHGYGGLPFIFGYCDSTPLGDEAWRGVSPLLVIYESWMMKNRVATQIVNAMESMFWPAVLVYDPNNDLGGQLDRDPRSFNIVNAPRSESGVEIISGMPQMQIAQVLMQIMSGAVDQSTFPSVLYGEAPGQVTAGYAIANLSSAARGRVGLLRESIELAIADMLDLVFHLVRVKAKNRGVEVWNTIGGDRLGAGTLKLTAKDLKDDMPIIVQIQPDIPVDDQAEKALALQMVDKRIISRETFAHEYGGVKYPEREMKRILYEMALDNEQLRNRMIAEAYEEQTGEPLYEQQDRVAGFTGGSIGGSLGQRVPPGAAVGDRGLPVSVGGMGPGSPGGMPGGIPPGPAGVPPVGGPGVIPVGAGPQAGVRLPSNLMPPQVAAPVTPQPPPGVPPEIWMALRTGRLPGPRVPSTSE